jgi:hypothetical protein
MRGAGFAVLIFSSAVIGTGASTVQAAQDAPAPSAEPEVAQPNPPVEGAGAAPTEAATFETLVRNAAEAATDLTTMLAPFADNCDGDKRELDRARCRTTRAYLRRVIPRRSFWAVVDDPLVIAVSEFDASVKGYHLSIAGCLACTHPVTVGTSQGMRLLTLKVPDKDAGSLRAAVEISHSSVGFDSLGEAKTWLARNRRALRTQFVFQPAETQWTFGSSRGYAMTLLGLRVFNRCSGEVLISRPPSTGIVDVPGADDGCDDGGHGPDADNPRRSSVPTADNPLSKDDIARAMNIIRPDVFTCFEKFHVPGIAQFDFEVAANGAVNKVRLAGAFSGTPTGACLIAAGQSARFPSSSRERQQFSYPFFLRR